MDRTDRQNRVREALGRLYEQQPPYFREYVRRFREDPTSRVFAPLAEAYRRLGQVDEAIEICREGLGHHPDFHGGRVALAKCYIDKKMHAEARQELERVVQAVPENLLAQRLLGDVYLALRDSLAALHCYKMALLLSPNDVALAEKVHLLERNEEVFLASLDDMPAVPEDPELQTHTDTGLRLMSLDEQPPTSSHSDVDDIPPLWATGAETPRPVAPARTSTPTPSADNDPFGADLEKALAASLDDQLIPEPTAATNAADIEQLLGDSNVDDEAFKIEHVSSIFGEEGPKKEITTETLGDLYFSQGQYDRALRIFEKLKVTPDLVRKIDQCRMKLGVDRETAVRNRKILALKAVLKRVQEAKRA